jgi:hypothetical protein
MTNQIEAIQSNIIFKFTEDVTQTRFVNKAASGILVTSGDGNQTLMPRWGEALFVGPDVTEVNVGDFILIEPGKWTFGFYIGDARYWKTDEDKIIGVSDEPGETY